MAVGLLRLIRTIFIAVAIAVTFRTFAYEPFVIPSGSMLPNLLIGDYIFVSKLSYGYSRYSLPFVLPLLSGRIFGQIPQRGDIVVFQHPQQQGVHYIKRVIGLPGDQLRMHEGRLYINGGLVDRHQDKAFSQSSDSRPVNSYTEQLPEGRTYRIIETWGDVGPRDNTQLYEVPQDHIFVMGDNRDDSQDSRSLIRLGPVPVENIVGKAEIVFFSIEGGKMWQIWKWPNKLRVSRLLSKIQ